MPGTRAVTVAALLLFVTLPRTAASEPITVGEANNSNCLPFGCNFGTSRYQQVYDASAFPDVIAIRSLTFTEAFSRPEGGVRAVLSGNYVVSLSTTSRAVKGLNAGSMASNVGPDAARFFEGDLGGVFPTPTLTIRGAAFTYRPAAGNLLLDIQISNQGMPPLNTNVEFPDSDTRGVVMSRLVAFFGSDVAFLDDTVGLVTTFNSAPAVVPEPASLLLVAGALGMAHRRFAARTDRQR